MNEVATFENGDRSSRYPNKGDLVEEGVPFFGAPDIKDGKLTFSEDLRFITNEKFNELSNGKLINRDFVILLRGSVGKVAQFIENDQFRTGFINAQMLIVRLTETALDGFIYKFFISDFSKNIEDQKSGAVIQQLPASKISLIKIPIPPLSEQKRIVEKVDALMTLCESLKANIRESQSTQLHLADAMADQVLN